MSITATELKSNLGKYLLLAATEDIFITKNGKGDLAVMSIETYEALTSRFELYVKLQEGLDDVAAGRTRPWKDVKAELLNHWGRE